MRYKIFTATLLCLLMVNSCISDFHVELPEGSGERLIIEGNIVAQTESRFYLSKSIPLGSDKDVTPAPVTNAKLVIIGSDGYRSTAARHVGEGAYDIRVDHLSADVSYGIEIEYDGEVYQSEPAVPLQTPEIENVTWTQTREYGDISIRVSTNDATGGYRYYLWYYQEDWETTANYRNRFYYDPVKGEYYETPDYEYFYCWDNHIGHEILLASTEALTENRIIDRELFTRSADDIRFSELYAVNVRQLSVSKDAYDYFFNIRKYNSEMGGLFTPQPSDVEGNITCITNEGKKAVGYISVCNNVTEKRMFIQPEEVTSNYKKENCVELSEGQIKTMLSQGYTLTYIYQLGWRPQGFFTFEDGELKVYIDFWTSVECIDCRETKGIKNKPDFWPNNHE